MQEACCLLQYKFSQAEVKQDGKIHSSKNSEINTRCKCVLSTNNTLVTDS